MANQFKNWCPKNTKNGPNTSKHILGGCFGPLKVFWRVKRCKQYLLRWPLGAGKWIEKSQNHKTLDSWPSLDPSKYFSHHTKHLPRMARLLSPSPTDGEQRPWIDIKALHHIHPIAPRSFSVCCITFTSERSEDVWGHGQSRSPFERVE